MRIEIEIFVRNGNGIKNYNRNKKPLPTIFYSTELDTVVL